MLWDIRAVEEYDTESPRRGLSYSDKKSKRGGVSEGFRKLFGRFVSTRLLSVIEP